MTDCVAVDGVVTDEMVTDGVAVGGVVTVVIVIRGVAGEGVHCTAPLLLLG